MASLTCGEMQTGEIQAPVTGSLVWANLQVVDVVVVGVMQAAVMASLTCGGVQTGEIHAPVTGSLVCAILQVVVVVVVVDGHGITAPTEPSALVQDWTMLEQSSVEQSAANVVSDTKTSKTRKQIEENDFMVLSHDKERKVKANNEA